MDSLDASGRRRKRVVMWMMALAVLLPSLYGFGTKFLEFIALYRGDVDGVFAITPILNYLLASLGFLCLFGWAALGGMFRDVEQPKRTMLENEARLDNRAPWRRAIGLDYPLRGDLPAARVGQAQEHHRFRNLYDHD
jgi:hypothetical protein